MFPFYYELFDILYTLFWVFIMSIGWISFAIISIYYYAKWQTNKMRAGKYGK
jgi:hypothetical protein